MDAMKALLVALLATCAAARPMPHGRSLLHPIIGKGGVGNLTLPTLPAPAGTPAPKTFNPIGFGKGFAGVSVGTKTYPGWSYTTGAPLTISKGGFSITGSTHYGKGAKGAPGPAPTPGNFQTVGIKVDTGGPAAATIDGPPFQPATKTVTYFKPGYGPNGKLPAAPGAPKEAPPADTYTAPPAPAKDAPKDAPKGP